jgi:hypothetical protein
MVERRVVERQLGEVGLEPRHLRAGLRGARAPARDELRREVTGRHLRAVLGGEQRDVAVPRAGVQDALARSRRGGVDQ